jgi:hypothetical protein
MGKLSQKHRKNRGGRWPRRAIGKEFRRRMDHWTAKPRHGFALADRWTMSPDDLSRLAKYNDRERVNASLVRLFMTLMRRQELRRADAVT